MLPRRRIGLWLLGAAVGGAMLLGHASPAQACDAYTYRSWLNPRDPHVGETYSLYITVTNTASRSIRFTADVVNLPNGDRLLGAAQQYRTVAPGCSYTFRFDIYCGVPGGTVNWNLRAAWAR
jgi:hypothetical protein